MRSLCSVSTLGNDLQGSIVRETSTNNSIGLCLASINFLANTEEVFRRAPAPLCAHLPFCLWLCSGVRYFNSTTQALLANVFQQTHAPIWEAQRTCVLHAYTINALRHCQSFFTIYLGYVAVAAQNPFSATPYLGLEIWSNCPRLEIVRGLYRTRHHGEQTLLNVRCWPRQPQHGDTIKKRRVRRENKSLSATGTHELQAAAISTAPLLCICDMPQGK